MAAAREATRRSQIAITLAFLGLFLGAGHLGIWFVLFPPDPGARLLGFPAHYALALLAGWPVLLALAALYAVVANRLDDRIGGEGPNGTKGTTSEREDA